MEAKLLCQVLVNLIYLPVFINVKFLHLYLITLFFMFGMIFDLILIFEFWGVRTQTHRHPIALIKFGFCHRIGIADSRTLSADISERFRYCMGLFFKMSVLSLFYGFCTVQNVWLSELYKVHDIIGVVEGWRGGNLPFMSLPPLLLKGGRKWPQIYGKLWYKCLQMAEIGKNLQIIITNNEKTDKISFETPLWEIAPPPNLVGLCFSMTAV